MTRRRKISEGKAKVIYTGPTPDTMVMHFKDDATAFNKAKMSSIAGKGSLNNKISEKIFILLSNLGMNTHFIKRINMREQLVRKAEMIPLEVCVRNFAAGSIVKNLGVEEGHKFNYPIIEFYYKDDEKNDPLMTKDHIIQCEIAEESEYYDMLDAADNLNKYLSCLFCSVGIRLFDFKVEFGRLLDVVTGEKSIILCDEISPDCCRLRDIETGKILDKDLFRMGKTGMLEAYGEIAQRLGISVNDSLTSDISESESEIDQNIINSKNNTQSVDKIHHRVRVVITLKRELLDPQGKAILSIAKREGFNELSSVRQGKVVDLFLEKDDSSKEDLFERIESLCGSLLANQIIEEYEVDWGNL